MIFALATDESTLFVFDSIAEAIAYCEGIDVENGNWIFWDDAGAALKAEFLTPVHHGRFAIGGGTYQLIQAPDKPSLVASIDSMRHIDSNPHFATLSAVRDHLKTARKASQSGA